MNTRLLIRNFVSLFAGNVLGQLFFFFALALLARTLGPAEFGAWNFAQVFMLYLLRGSEFGLETIGIRETARDPHSTSRWIALIVSSRMIAGTVLFFVAVGASIAGLFPSGTERLVVIASLCVFPTALMLEWVFEARQEVDLLGVARVLRGVLFFVAVYLFVGTAEDAELASYLYAGCLLVSVLIVSGVAVRKFGFDWSAFNLSSWMKALKHAGPIGASSMLSQYSLFASTMVVGYFLQREELGYFTAANRIVIFLWAYVILSMHRVLLPNLSRLFHESADDYRRFITNVFRLSVLATVPIGMIGTLLAGPSMRLLYSSQYDASAPVFGILLWGFVMATIRTILELALIASDRQGRLLKGTAFLAILYTLFTPPLTLLYGIMGAAVAVLLSETAYIVFLSITSPFATPRELASRSWKPLVSAAVPMAAALQFRQLDPFVQAAIGFSLFVGLLYVLKGVTSEDLMQLRTVLQRPHAEDGIA